MVCKVLLAPEHNKLFKKGVRFIRLVLYEVEIMNIENEVKKFKTHVSTMSEEESMKHFSEQQKAYDIEYKSFKSAYDEDKCYMCGNPFSSISTEKPCLHWLLRRCKFKKKDFKKISEAFDFYQISAYLRWVAFAESGAKNINNLKEESSDRKKFEVTIKWKNIEWTLDCSHNDFAGHAGSKTDFPHWHFQMRIDGRQFINFNDYHIQFSNNDQLKLTLENDQDSGFEHNFGYAGEGMQEVMDDIAKDFDGHMESAMSASNPDDGSVHIQSMVMAPDGGISGEKIDEALEMHRKTGKTLQYCFSKVLESDENVSIKSIVSPSESVPEIAKRTERTRR